MDSHPITARSLVRDYHINADIFERAYKDHLSGFRTWPELAHADKWLVFPWNMGEHLSIDETCVSRGEVYTIVTNKDAHGLKGCLVAIVRGTKAKDVIKALKKIPEQQRLAVKEITLDFSDSMHSIAETCFTKAMITLDRFHHQQFCLEATQEVRREYRRVQMACDAAAREAHKIKMKELQESDGPFVDEEGNAVRRNAKYYPERMENDETRAEVLARSKGLLMMSPDKWTDTQKERAEILFREFPGIKAAFELTHSLWLYLDTCN